METCTTQLYEQGANTVSIGQYVRRWWWVKSGLEGELKEQMKKTGAMSLLPLEDALESSLFFLFSQFGTKKPS